jgi:hypothetical protein
MAIYGVGAYYGEDVSGDFLQDEVVGVGWATSEAPELQEYFKSLKVGDIVYIKAAFGGADITVKGIGIIKDNIIRDRNNTNGLVETGRSVVWITKHSFVIKRPVEKNNVRSNTVYEEFHPVVQAEIISRIAHTFKAASAATRGRHASSALKWDFPHFRKSGGAIFKSANSVLAI